MPRGVPNPPDAECVMADCHNGGRIRRGLCGMHYKRRQRGMPMQFTARTVAERFWARVIWATDNCWIWTGSQSDHGYGTFGVRGTGVGAHRWAYEHLIAPIASGMELDHLCRVRACVNPFHLEVVTRTENLRRSWAARKVASA